MVILDALVAEREERGRGRDAAAACVSCSDCEDFFMAVDVASFPAEREERGRGRDALIFLMGGNQSNPLTN